MASRIIATCPKCHAKLSVSAENAGKRLRCPKCKTAIPVPDQNADARQPVRGTTQWNVMDGIETGGPFGNSELRTLVDAKRLSAKAFVRDTDRVTNWREIQTISWLSDLPEPRVVRYCPECACRLSIATVSDHKPARCPACSAPTQFVDYFSSDEEPKLERLLAEPWSKSDTRVVFAVIVALTAGTFGTIALLRYPQLTLLIGFISLATGCGLFYFLLYQRQQNRRFRILLPKIESEFDTRTERLRSVLSELGGLKRGLVEVRNAMKTESEKGFRRKRALIAEERRLSEKASNQEKLAIEGLKQDLVEARNAMDTKAENGFERTRAAIADERRFAEAAICQQRLAIATELGAARYAAKAVNRMAERFLNETQKWWSSKLNGDNFQTTKDRIVKAIEFCRKHGYAVPLEQEHDLMQQLRANYEMVLRREYERSEQKRIREQMKEEQRIERELRRELERIDTEKRVIQKALDEALAKAGDEHSAEVATLRERLGEAEERGQRTKAQAELTKAGHVYVISNVGAFGDNIFKVGLTRRLEPTERVKELSGASVPFPFDVHMMISSEDSPKLERSLHKALHGHRVNRVNFRKEFFRVDLETIRAIVEEHHGVVEYVVDAEALQYRESLNISEEDFEFLAKVAEATGIDNEDDDFDGVEETLPKDAE